MSESGTFYHIRLGENSGTASWDNRAREKFGSSALSPGWEVVFMVDNWNICNTSSARSCCSYERVRCVDWLWVSF